MCLRDRLQWQSARLAPETVVFGAVGRVIAFHRERLDQQVLSLTGDRRQRCTSGILPAVAAESCLPYLDDVWIRAVDDITLQPFHNAAQRVVCQRLLAAHNAASRN
ncbi:hypothetical protein D3C72_1494500 [compost metagenome]